MESFPPKPCGCRANECCYECEDLDGGTNFSHVLTRPMSMLPVDYNDMRGLMPLARLMTEEGLSVGNVADLCCWISSLDSDDYDLLMEEACEDDEEVVFRREGGDFVEKDEVGKMAEKEDDGDSDVEILATIDGAEKEEKEDDGKSGERDDGGKEGGGE